MDSRYNKDVTKDSKSNKCYHKVTNLTSDNKSNKSYQSVTNLTINDYENDNDDVLFQKEEEKVFGSSPLKPLQELFDLYRICAESCSGNDKGRTDTKKGCKTWLVQADY